MKKAGKENFQSYTQRQSWQANEHNTVNNLCVKWHDPEGSDLSLGEKSVFELKAEYIWVTPLTIKKVLANSSFQTFLNRIISPGSFLLWVFLEETKSRVMEPTYILVVATWKMDCKLFEFRLFLLAYNNRLFSLASLMFPSKRHRYVLFHCESVPKCSWVLCVCVYLGWNKR